MNKKYIIGFILLIILVALGGMLFFKKNRPDQENEISRLRAEIESIIQTEAEDISSCKVLPIGHKACGGPEEYVVYSTKTTDVSYLQKISSQYTNEVQSFNKKNGVISTCDVPVEPEVELVEGNCTKILP